ncbi:REP-associated tyrosine transposase [Aestuariivita boseongensis]|uniref:REP-associated tyrosine transposase n=1 Tax=Aestuariivita boseongensis TaxID=1470562 RepID=UPI000B2E5AF2
MLEHLELLRDAVRQARNDRSFAIEAWVVLPDHMHAVWTLPEGDHDYSVRWSAIKSRFTAAVCRAGFSPPFTLPIVQSGRYAGLKPGLRQEKRERGIWQRRFWEHHCRSERDLQKHMRYCWLNPVKHGLVDRPVDWIPSSIHRDIRLGRVDPEWSGIDPEGYFGEVA